MRHRFFHRRCCGNTCENCSIKWSESVMYPCDKSVFLLLGSLFLTIFICFFRKLHFSKRMTVAWRIWQRRKRCCFSSNPSPCSDPSSSYLAASPHLMLFLCKVPRNLTAMPVLNCARLLQCRSSCQYCSPTPMSWMPDLQRLWRCVCTNSGQLFFWHSFWSQGFKLSSLSKFVDCRFSSWVLIFLPFLTTCCSLLAELMVLIWASSIICERHSQLLILLSWPASMH